MGPVKVAAHEQESFTQRDQLDGQALDVQFFDHRRPPVQRRQQLAGSFLMVGEVVKASTTSTR